jgi:hypothetical protein
MRTDDLIAALSRDAAPALPPVGKLLARALLFSVPVTWALFVLVFDLRDDVAEAAGEGWFALKLGLAALAAFAGWRLVSAASAPGRLLPAALLGLLAAALVAANGADLALMGAEGWRERLVGDNAFTCLVSIPMLSAAPLAGALLALRDAAPTRPALAGAAAGLMAGAVGALFYGLHCTDDSPLFFSVWYLLAIGLVALAGVAAGRALLRW